MTHWLATWTKPTSHSLLVRFTSLPFIFRIEPQVFPQSGHLAMWDFNFIGRLETLEQEWTALSARLPGHGDTHTVSSIVNKFDFPTFAEINPNAKSHISGPGGTDEQKEFQDAIELVFARRGDLLQGVLGLLQPDIHCIGAVRVSSNSPKGGSLSSDLIVDAR
jgi:hypothetical protein